MAVGQGETYPALALADMDWAGLLRETSKHGIKGLVWDTVLQHRDISARLSAHDKVEWFGQVHMTGQRLRKAAATVKDFAKVMQPWRMVILKGVDYARYWPSADMREFGDMDCFVLDALEDVDHALEFDQTAQERGCGYEAGNYKHSHLFYKGLMIENHHYFTGFATSGQAREHEVGLREFMAEGVRENECGCLSPNANFTALFMMSHACSHFLYEGINLRFVLDWLFFLREEQNHVDWGRVYQAMEQAGIRPFAELLTAYCTEYLGWRPTNAAITRSEDTALLRAFNDDILESPMDDHDRRWYMMTVRMAHRLKRHWRFRAVARTSILRTVWNTVAYSSVWHRKPRLDTTRRGDRQRHG